MKRKKLWLQVPQVLLVAVLLVACGIPQPASPPRSTTAPASQTPVPTEPPSSNPPAGSCPDQSTSPLHPVQIRISTTSDWTHLRLLSGGAWCDLTVTLASEQALTAEPEGDRLSLTQSLGRAEAGHRVELVADLYLYDLDSDGRLVFEIDRGHIGSTQVELLDYRDGVPNEIAVLTWDGINSGTQNTEEYEVSLWGSVEAPVEPPAETRPNEYVVIAQLNFWYYGPGEFGGFEDSNGNRTTPLTPLLGETYWASDPDVVYQQIEWAVEYGVDAFSIEWTTPRGVGCCGSMEDTLDDVFLQSPNIHKTRFAIFYDFVLRLMQTPDLDVNLSQGINFDQPDVYNTYVSDFVHFAVKYFGHPQHLTIDGRPVIYVWASNQFRGNFAGAMQEARQRVSELGFDVFVVGDEVCVGCFDPNHAALFDGSSTFTFLIPGLDHSWANIGEAAVAVDGAFQWWRDQIAGLRVVGREEYVNFQPAWAPQYDERLFESRRGIYVPAQSRAQVVAMATVARDHTEPVGSSQMRLVWLNTWNNWAETTTVEPTADLGPRYPAGNYHFDMLEVIRQVFGAETFPTSP